VDLSAEVRSRLDGLPGRFGFFARNLATGERVELNAAEPMPTESAAKTFILIHYSLAVSSGTCDEQARVKLDEHDRTFGSGVLRFLAPGLQLTLNDLAWLMITISDNVATQALLRVVGGADAVNATMARLGFPTAWLNPAFRYEDLLAGVVFATSTPRDLAEAYVHLDERCRTILFRAQHHDALPRRLPHAAETADWGFDMPVRVFNKVGGGPGVLVDAGLFETDHAAWVVAAMASEQQDFASRPDDVAPAVFADLGELLHAAWSDKAS
jgi:beta-lactamase class A